MPETIPGQGRLVGYLLAHGADPNISDGDGEASLSAPLATQMYLRASSERLSRSANRQLPAALGSDWDVRHDL